MRTNKYGLYAGPRNLISASIVDMYRLTRDFRYLDAS